MLEMILSAFLGAIAGVLLSGTGTYIAFNDRLKDLERESEGRRNEEQREDRLIAERVAQVITDTSVGLKEKSRKIDSTLSEIKEKTEGQRSQINLLAKDIQNVREIYEKLDHNTLNSLRDADLSKARTLIEMTSQNSDVIDLQLRLNNLEQSFKEQKGFNKYQDLIKMNKYSLNQENIGDLNSDTIGDRYKEFWIDFDHHFDSPPIVFIALVMIDASTEIYSTDVKWQDLSPLTSLRFLTSLSARFTRIGVEVKKGSITKKGFTAVAHTWHDSKVFGLDIAWIAFGS